MRAAISSVVRFVGRAVATLGVRIIMSGYAIEGPPDDAENILAPLTCDDPDCLCKIDDPVQYAEFPVVPTPEMIAAKTVGEYLAAGGVLPDGLDLPDDLPIMYVGASDGEMRFSAEDAANV